MLDTDMKTNNKFEIPHYDNEEMESRAFDATNLLKSLGHEGRLMILCHLKPVRKRFQNWKNLFHCPKQPLAKTLRA